MELYYLQGCKEITDPIVGFEDSVRKFVCHTISITYQRIPEVIFPTIKQRVESKPITTLSITSQLSFFPWFILLMITGDSLWVTWSFQRTRGREMDIAEQLEVRRTSRLCLGLQSGRIHQNQENHRENWPGIGRPNNGLSNLNSRHSSISRTSEKWKIPCLNDTAGLILI